MKTIKRCPWAKQSDLLLKYHDEEWGVPQYDESSLFAALSLEIFQAGLQWELILKKRDELYKAFDGFNYQKIAKYSLNDLNQLLNNSSIIRNRAKITAVIQNARALVKLHRRKITLTDLTWRLVNLRLWII